MFIKSLSIFLAGLSMLVAQGATAQAKPMKLESAVQVLKSETEGAEPRLIDAQNVVPGDTLVFTTRFSNESSAAIDDFVIVNPVPANVVLVEEPEAAAEVSVDGAKTWGKLAQLVIIESDGQGRPATIGDITHLRWAFSEVPSGEAGQVRFNATVR